MKKFFILILALITTTSVFSQQIYNSLTVKNLFVPTSATFSTSFSGVAKLSSGVLSASPLVNADVSNSAAISYTKLSGVVDTSTAQSISGNKSFLNNFSVTGTTTLATSLSGYLKATAGVVSSVSQVDLSTDVVGTLPITNGGTGSTSKSWVDLTTNQSGIAGNKAFTGNLSTSGTMLASNLSGTNTGDLITQGVTGLNSAVTNILEFPLNQVTTTATGTRRVDTGNGNVLANSSFESSTVGLGWQATNVTVAASTTNVQDGVKSIQITSTTSNWSFDYQSSLYPSAKAGQSAEGSLWVQSTGTGSNDIWLCEGSYTATPVLGPCDKYDGSGQPRQLRIYTPFKSIGSGIRLMGNTSGTVIHADAAKFDNRDFSYSNYNFTDWVSYTPIWTASTTNPSIGNGTLQGKWRRVGDSMEIRTYLQYGSTSTKGSGFYLLSIPPGYAVDLSKLPNSSSLANIGDGQYISQLSVAGSQVQSAFLESTTTFKMLTDQNASSNLFSSAQSNVFTSTNDNWATSIKVPIAGWDSNNAAVASESVQVSSDTMNFSFKTTAIVDSDPIGTYNTFYMNGGTNAYIRCTSSPTQTQANMNANGFQIFSRIYSASSTCAQPTRVEVRVPAGLKSINTTLFGGTGKTTPLATGVNQVSATVLSGTSQLYYPSAGILAYDAGYNYSTGFTQRFVDSEVNRTDGYFVFSASRYADIASIPVFVSKNTNAYATSFANLINNTTVDIQGYAIRESNNSNFNTATGVYTVPQGDDGMYCMGATSSLTAPSGTGIQTITYIKKNGSNYITSPSVNTTVTTASSFVGSSANGCSRLKATDTLSVAVYQISGGNRTISSVDFYITKVGN